MDGDPAFEKQKADSIDQIKSVHVPRLAPVPISTRAGASTDTCCAAVRADVKWAVENGYPIANIASS